MFQLLLEEAKPLSMEVRGRGLAPALGTPARALVPRQTVRSAALSCGWPILLLLSAGIPGPSSSGKHCKLATTLKLSPRGSDPEQGRAYRLPGGEP